MKLFPWVVVTIAVAIGVFGCKFRLGRKAHRGGTPSAVHSSGDGLLTGHTIIQNERNQEGSIQLEEISEEIVASGSDSNGMVLDIKTAALEAKKEGLKRPEANEDGRYSTLNGKGTMVATTRASTKQFIEIAAQRDSKVLEIGAAYGYICKEALKRGASDYTIVEMEKQHLQILAKEIVEEMPEKAQAVKLIHGAFPDASVLKLLPSNSYDAILAFYVFHFFTNEKQVKTAFHELQRLLKPGGKIMLSMASMYFPEDKMKPEFVKQLAEELEVFKNGDRETDLKLPGAVENTRSHFDEAFADRINMSNEPCFLYDEAVVRYLLRKEKFTVEKCEYFNVGGAWKTAKSQKDHLEVIAQKPE